MPLHSLLWRNHFFLELCCSGCMLSWSACAIEEDEEEEEEEEEAENAGDGTVKPLGKGPCRDAEGGR